MTPGGVTNIDAFTTSPARFALPDVAVISIHPPGPCRAYTSGYTHEHGT